MDFAELTTALATGVVDGQENPLTAIMTSNMYDSQKFLILTDHMINIIPLFANSDSIAKLSPEFQTAVREAAVQAGQDILAISVADHERLKGELAGKGMTVISTEDGLDLEAFRSRVGAHVEAKFPEWGEIIAGIRAIQ